MASLVIHLQDGFSMDEVVIVISDCEVFHKEAVSTNYAIGLAESIELEVPEGPIDVSVQVLTAQLSETIQVQVPDRIYLAVSRAEEGLVYEVSEEGFLYL